MEPIALLGLVALLFVKEAGVPVPVPGDLLVVAAGVAAAASGPAALAALGAILLAGYLGGSVQFLLVRGALRERIVALLGRLGVPRARLDALAALLQRRGATGVAIARATPGVRIGAIAASALAALPISSFVPGLVVGNTLFVGGHFALGMAVGAPALALAASLGGVAVAAVAFVALAVAGFVGWRLIRRRAAGRTPAPAQSGAWSNAAAWADAACPACLALAVARPTEAPAP